MSRLVLGILGSGKGSNCRAILEQIHARKLDADARLIVSDVSDSGMLKIAREFDVPARYFPSAKFRTRYEPEEELELAKMLKAAGVELVVLAGFMRVLKEPMLNAFPRRIINLHPSLLPKFPGLEAWSQALAAGEKVTGCTVHYVDAEVDSGEIIAQREVSILAGDTAESLHARIQIAERELYPEVIGSFAAAKNPNVEIRNLKQIQIIEEKK
jgi:phosphoribosylglycinamide formyltransferase-1